MFSEYLNRKEKQHPITNNFLITLNPNLAPRDEKEIVETKNKLKHALNLIFSRFEDFIDIYEGGKFNKKKSNVKFEDVASNVAVVPRVEVGKQKHNVHSHTMVSWSSSDKYFFQINVRKLRDWVDKHVVKSPHLEVKWIKNNRAVWEYVNKDYEE